MSKGLLYKYVRKIYSYFLFYTKGGVAYARHEGVLVGDGCRIYTMLNGTEPFLIEIGSRVTITSGVKILTHDGSTWLVRDADGVRRQRYARVKIDDDVFIGIGVIILPGVSIGSKVIIGAGSVVTKDIPENSVAVGNPARIVASFSEYEIKINKTCVSDRDLEGVADYKEKVLRAIECASKK